jgi:hypothetical protein
MPIRFRVGALAVTDTVTDDELGLQRLDQLEKIEKELDAIMDRSFVS